MNYENTTQVPNLIFDELLNTLNFSELKLLLMIIRQTNGWIDKRTGNRKVKDRISYGQFIDKTHLSRRRISSAIQTLIEKELIVVTDFPGNCLLRPSQRKGKKYLYYQCIIQPVQYRTATNALREPKRMHSMAHNKTNRTKTNKTKQTNIPHRISSLIEEIKKSMEC